jgi:hypothetical protein
MVLIIFSELSIAYKLNYSRRCFFYYLRYYFSLYFPPPYTTYIDLAATTYINLVVAYYGPLYYRVARL